MTASDYTGVVVSISDIDPGVRIRSDMGNIPELAASIQAVGLLHPVVITGEWKLVAGDRRLAAARHLGWTEVPVTVVDLDTAADILRAEMDENTCRKELTEVEAERARERRSEVLAADADRRRKEAILAQERDEKGRVLAAPPNLGEAGTAAAKARETAKVAAIGTGYSGSTLDKVKQMMTVAEQGVIRLDGRTLPAPPEVREVAAEAIATLAERDTTDTAPRARETSVDHLHQKVAAAIAQHVEPDEQAKRDRAIKTWRDALGGVRAFREFEMTELPGLLSEEDWARAAGIVESLAEQVDKFREVRATEFRDINRAGTA